RASAIPRPGASMPAAGSAASARQAEGSPPGQAAPIPTDAPAAPASGNAAGTANAKPSAGSVNAAPKQDAPAAERAGSAPPGAASEEVECPQCGHRNKTGNRFCASCGFNIGSASTGAAVAARAPSPSGSP